MGFAKIEKNSLGGINVESFAIALFAVAVIGIPITILLVNDYGTKRGCGRGCDTCRNREICHGKKRQQEKKP